MALSLTDKEKIINYIMNTPYNTNWSVLLSMLGEGDWNKLKQYIEITPKNMNKKVLESLLTITEPIDEDYRTVLYTDGTLIINESSRNEAHNIELHGQPTNVYAPFDPNGATDADKYIFAPYNDGAIPPWVEFDEDDEYYYSLVEAVEIGSIIHPTSTAFWFFEMNGCGSMNLNSLDTSNVTNMGHMFSHCSSMTSIDVSSFDTSSVTNMENMFDSCSSMTNLDVSSFNTSNVTNMRNMFSHCSSIINLDVSSFNTSSVTNMSNMFNSCSSMTSINISSFDTSNVTNMINMFYSCSSITNLDVSSFDTSSVTSMSNMFNSCSSIINLDVSSFDTSSVTSMDNMFSNCKALTTIYTSMLFVVTQVTYSSRMFAYMSTNLVGGAGTIWDNSNPKDKTYAHIDGGVSNPGYFTAK